MAKTDLSNLSRREREIMDVLFRLGQASVADVQSFIPQPPSYSAVRTMLGRLESKGYVTHVQVGPRYLYRPIMDPEIAKVSALERMIRTFYAGSHGKTVAALLDHSAEDLTQEELTELGELIQRMKRGKSNGD